MPGLTPADVLAQIRAAEEAPPDPMCRRAVEWAEEWKMSPQNAARIIAKAIRQGQMREERRRYRKCNGTVHTASHYRWIGKAK
jgi:hypothetical protein